MACLPLMGAGGVDRRARPSTRPRPGRCTTGWAWPRPGWSRPPATSRATSGPQGIRVNLVAAGPLRTMAAKSIPGFDAVRGRLGRAGAAGLGPHRPGAGRPSLLRAAVGLVPGHHRRDRPRRRRLPRGRACLTVPSQRMGRVAYDAFLLRLLRRSGGARRRAAVPGERHPRARRPARSGWTRSAEHYHHFGGVSPINAAVPGAARRDRPTSPAGIDLPVYWGNRNWHPLLADTVAPMRDDGVRRALGVRHQRRTASYSSCRQYQEDIAAGPGGGRAGAPEIDKMRHFHDHPGFVEPHADAVRAALATLDRPGRHAPGWSSPRTRSRPSMARRSRPGRAAGTPRSCTRPPRLVRGGRGAGPAVGPGLAEPVRAAAGAVAGAGHQRPPRGAGRRGRHRRGGQPDRVRLRPPRGALGPRQRGRARRPPSSAWATPGRRRPAPTRGSSRWCGSWCRSATADSARSHGSVRCRSGTSARPTAAPARAAARTPRNAPEGQT